MSAGRRSAVRASAPTCMRCVRVRHRALSRALTTVSGQVSVVVRDEEPIPTPGD